MRKQIVIVRCDYEEYNPASYRGMKVYFPNTREVIFSMHSDNPETDLTLCDVWAEREGYLLFQSSSVDNFFLDVENGVFVI